MRGNIIEKVKEKKEDYGSRGKNKVKSVSDETSDYARGDKETLPGSSEF
jgi:hypothetical protein